VLEHFREGEVNIFRGISFSRHPEGDELTYETSVPHRANPVNYMSFFKLLRTLHGYLSGLI
jgi:hypothetical protein